MVGYRDRQTGNYIDSMKTSWKGVNNDHRQKNKYRLKVYIIERHRKANELIIEKPAFEYHNTRQTNR